MDLNNLRYQHIERALAALYNVQASELKAFRARIRHLRNIGVPSIDKVGKGTQITYTRRHLWEIFIAIELTRCGISPQVASHISRIFDSSCTLMDEIDNNTDERFLFIAGISIFNPEGDNFLDYSTRLTTPKEYAEEIQAGRLDVPHVIIEFSESIRLLEGAIS